MEIAGLILGLVALVIAIPPLLQMVYGRPKIRVGFDMSTEQGAKLLLCNIYNRPITNWFLKKIGVTLTPTDVFASFDIREHGTNKIIASAFRARLHDAKANTTGLSLAAKPSLPVVFVVIEHDDKGAITIDHAPSQTKELRLELGEYFADVKIAWGEATVRAVAQSFTIDANKDATHWTARKVIFQ